MSSIIEKYFSDNPSGEISTPNWVLAKLLSDKRHPLRAAAAAWIYSFMLHRAAEQLPAGRFFQCLRKADLSA